MREDGTREWLKRTAWQPSMLCAYLISELSRDGWRAFAHSRSGKA
jgi:hypothetical protein